MVSQLCVWVSQFYNNRAVSVSLSLLRLTLSLQIKPQGKYIHIIEVLRLLAGRIILEAMFWIPHFAGFEDKVMACGAFSL